MILKKILATRRQDSSKILIQSIQVINNVLKYEIITNDGEPTAHEYHLRPEEIHPPQRQPCCDEEEDKTRCGLKKGYCEAPHQCCNHSTDHQLIKYILVRILNISVIHDMETDYK